MLCFSFLYGEDDLVHRLKVFKNRSISIDKKVNDFNKIREHRSEQITLGVEMCV